MRWSCGLGSGRSASSIRPILKKKKELKNKENKNETKTK